MNLEIRTAQSKDYQAITTIHNANNEPHFHITAEKLEQSDSKKTNGGRLVATQNNTIVGTAEFCYWQKVQAYRIAIYSNHPNISTALLKQIEQNTQTRAERLLTTIRSDFLSQATYLEQGFQEVFRSFGANLELEYYHPPQIKPIEGIRFLPREQWLGADAEKQLQQLQNEANTDIPSYEPVVTNNLDYTNRQIIEGFWVALHHNQCIGFTSLDARKSTIYFDSSTVARAWRNQGIGLALATTAVQWAKEQGYEEFNDGGAKANIAHIRILERLGFEIEPDWITFEKRFD